MTSLMPIKLVPYCGTKISNISLPSSANLMRILVVEKCKLSRGEIYCDIIKMFCLMGLAVRALR